ncbi:MAG: TolC family protein [Muribaculaceae bacterium]|nr:TolC family protein [Muribaculaceae bacterium]
MKSPMMKTAVIATAALISALSLNAENWTLDRCISYALDNNLTVKSRQIEIKSGELDVTAARDRHLPNISANASQSFSFGRGLTSDNTYTNRNTSNFGWSVNMSLPLFQGLSAVRQTKYAQANLRAMVEELEAAKDDITLNVISAYLQVLYAGEMCNVAEEQLRLATVEQKRREELLEAGKIPELDLTEARAQVAQNQLSLVNSQNDRTLALVDLAQLLELTDIDGFDIAPVEDDGLTLYSPEEVYNRALDTNHSLLAARRRIEAADRNISLAKSSYLPNLSFNAGIGSNYYTVSGINSENFGRQMDHNFNKSLGFSLSIPIFDAFSSRNSVRRAKIQHINAQLQYETSERNLYKTIQQAYYQAQGATEKLRAAEISADATREAFEAMQQKYDFGKANATEYEQARSNYVRATVEAVQAKYESILRRRILAFYNK